jgi:rhamnosyltransferase
MTVDIICPLYNAEKYIDRLHKSLLMQEDVKINKIIYAITVTNDNTLNYLKDNNCDYVLVDKKDFSHSLTRSNIGLKSNADIISFVTQDVVIEDKHWLKKLINPIENGEVAASYSRQITKFNNIEKYTRESNYSDKSYVKSKEDIEKFKISTFFFSDAACAIKTSVYKELNAYDNKNLPTNEDMYFAYKLIMNDYKIKYCSDSIVYHSHNFTLKQLYNRYKLTGKFFKQNSYLNEYKANHTGMNLAKYVLKRIIEEKRIDLLLRFPFDMGARYIGMKVGKM